MDLLKLLRGFVPCICSMYFSPFAKQRQAEVLPRSQSFCFELKVLNESKYSMPWAPCAFGNVLFLGGSRGGNCIWLWQQAVEVLLHKLSRTQPGHLPTGLAIIFHYFKLCQSNRVCTAVQRQDE